MANIITLSRIFLAFIAMGLLFIGPKNAPDLAHISVIITIFVMWFDGLDGFIARKFNESSKLGAVLDIMGDRIVENIYWMTFCALGWINVVVPIIVLTRGIITDSLRSLALEKGYTPFGEKTMMQGKVAKFIVASNFSRFTYAVCKAVAFFFMILGHSAFEIPHKDVILSIGIICTVISVIFCVLRGLPVIVESKRFLE
ncbi:TPA: CDP-alcohol phosphatidyltransferase family protein [Candidatus Galligastranaerophilus gallistercoris]|nr:CDP-alcohol phosphatidyltransferase family protein [Candidatus Galligastranaerophilus gallistercoris]